MLRFVLLGAAVAVAIMSLGCAGVSGGDTTESQRSIRSILVAYNADSDAEGVANVFVQPDNLSADFSMDLPRISEAMRAQIRAVGLYSIDEGGMPGDTLYTLYEGTDDSEALRLPISYALSERTLHPDPDNGVFNFKDVVGRLRFGGAMVRVMDKDRKPLLEGTAGGFRLHGLRFAGYVGTIQTALENHVLQLSLARDARPDAPPLKKLRGLVLARRTSGEGGATVTLLTLYRADVGSGAKELVLPYRADVKDTDVPSPDGLDKVFANIVLAARRGELYAIAYLDDIDSEPIAVPLTLF